MISLIVMWIPMYTLYEISIWLVWMIERWRTKKEAAEEAAGAAAQ